MEKKEEEKEGNGKQRMGRKCERGKGGRGTCTYGEAEERACLHQGRGRLLAGKRFVCSLVLLSWAGLTLTNWMASAPLLFSSPLSSSSSPPSLPPTRKREIRPLLRSTSRPTVSSLKVIHVFAPCLRPLVPHTHSGLVRDASALFVVVGFSNNTTTAAAKRSGRNRKTEIGVEKKKTTKNK